MHTGGPGDLAALRKGDVHVGGSIEGDAEEGHQERVSAELTVGLGDVGGPGVGAGAFVNEAPAEVSGRRQGIGGGAAEVFM